MGDMDEGLRQILTYVTSSERGFHNDSEGGVEAHDVKNIYTDLPQLESPVPIFSYEESPNVKKEAVITANRPMTRGRARMEEAAKTSTSKSQKKPSLNRRKKEKDVGDLGVHPDTIKKGGRSKTFTAFIPEAQRRSSTEQKRSKSVLKKGMELSILVDKPLFYASRNNDTGLLDVYTNVVEVEEFIRDVLFQAVNGSPCARVYSDDDYGKGIDDTKKVYAGVRAKKAPGRPSLNSKNEVPVIKHYVKEVEEMLNIMMNKKYVTTTGYRKGMIYNKTHMKERKRIETFNNIQMARVLNGVEPDTRFLEPGEETELQYEKPRIELVKVEKSNVKSPLDDTLASADKMNIDGVLSKLTAICSSIKREPTTMTYDYSPLEVMPKLEPYSESMYDIPNCIEEANELKTLEDPEQMRSVLRMLGLNEWC